MKTQALFSWKDKSKQLKCRLLQFLFGALRVKELPPLGKQAEIHALFLETRQGGGGIC